jgi:hypothetical protein
MKSKITKVSAITVLALAVLVVISAAFAEYAHDPVSGHGETELDFITGHASGDGTLTIRGTEMDVGIEVQLMGITKESDDGITHADVMHTFTFDNGSITTNDKAIMEPTEGGFILNERLTIVSGTGVFANVSGNLTVHGLVMFTSMTTADVSYDLHGVISGY